MTDNAKLVDFKKENPSKYKLVLEWKTNRLDQMKEPLRTPIFTWNKEKFYFEVWYQEALKGYVQMLSWLSVVLKKLLKTSIDSNQRFEFIISVSYSDMTLYTENKSAKTLNLAEFTTESCININSRFYNDLGLYIEHGRKMLSSRTLVFKCQIHFFSHFLSPSTYHSEIHSLNHFQKFNGDFWLMYQSETLSDVSFQIGDKTLKSHKFVLAAHSPVFKRMLEQDFLETKTGVITISDCETDVFEKFLKFLYTGEVKDKSFSNIILMYTLADKYDIQMLKEECIEILTRSNLNEEQIYEIRHLALNLNDDILKTTANSFLADHFEEKIVKTKLLL